MILRMWILRGVKSSNYEDVRVVAVHLNYDPSVLWLGFCYWVLAATLLPRKLVKRKTMKPGRGSARGWVWHPSPTR